MANISLLKQGLKTSLVEALYNEILTNSNNYYYFLGKTLTWGDLDNIEQPLDTAKYESAARNEIIFLKKITTADVSYVIPRYDWTSGQIYDMYDDQMSEEYPAYSGAEALQDSTFYVMTADNNVYKCLDNNNDSPSTVKPFSTSPTPIKTVDGYIWKYMYTVAVSARNKFMTLGDIPVSTAIKNQYYSRGSISSVIALQYGIDYEVGTQLVVAGDGFLEENPVKILSGRVIEPGEGYSTAPDVTIEDPFVSGEFTTSTSYIIGQYLKTTANKIYEVVASGTSGLAEPTHTSSNIVFNGTVGLKFVGITATATAVLDDDVLDSIVFSKVVGYINMDTTGYGYTSPPAVSITGDGDDATGVALLDPQGRVLGVEITNIGSGYTTASIEFTDNPVEEDSTWTSGGTVAVNDIILVSASGKYYQVASGTTLGTSAPAHTAGTVLNGTAQLTFIAQKAEASVELYAGYGYSFTPLITLSDEGEDTPANVVTVVEQTRARLVPIIENGQIIGAVSTNPGVGYTIATITVNGSGTGAELVANISNGDLTSSQSTIELLAVPGTIDAIKVVDEGSNYSSSVTVTVEGDGSGCTATGEVISGKLSKIIVTNPGSGYTKATVTITGTQSGIDPLTATARAIISPAEGHGKNAVLELCAKDISLFSSISVDRNQGFSVINDYRQLGIIKNPQQFESNLRLNSATGSTCFSVEATYQGSDGSNIPLDAIITDENQNEYRVVARTPGSNSVSLLLQSLDNQDLVLTQNLFYDEDTLTVTNLTAPTVNKYSGSMLFIDNRNSFVSNSQQTLSIKTAIRL